jgi:hypothetical protein
VDNAIAAWNAVIMPGFNSGGAPTVGINRVPKVGWIIGTDSGSTASAAGKPA